MNRSFLQLQGVAGVLVILSAACAGATARSGQLAPVPGTPAPAAVSPAPVPASPAATQSAKPIAPYSFNADELPINFPVAGSIGRCGLTQEQGTAIVRRFLQDHQDQMAAKMVGAVDVLNCFPDQKVLGVILHKAPGFTFTPPEPCQSTLHEIYRTMAGKDIPAPSLPAECYPPPVLEALTIPF